MTGMVIYFKKGQNPNAVTVEFSDRERRSLHWCELLTEKTAPEILREGLIMWLRSNGAEHTAKFFEEAEP